MASRSEKAKQKKRGQRDAARQAAQQARAQRAQAQRVQTERAQPRPYREERAPVFDYEAGRPQPGPAPRKKGRRKKEHMRITKAELKRRRRARRILAWLCVIGVILAGVALSVYLLFRVNAFEFQTMDGEPGGDTGSYTKEQIVSALGVAQGDNLFSFRTDEKQAALDTAFPLLERIELRRRLPGTVILRVEPAVESYTIQTGTGWLVLSKERKVMAVQGQQPMLPILRGSVYGAPQIGQTLALGTPVKNEETGETLPSSEQTNLERLLAALAQYDILGGVTEIDLTDPENMFFGYEERIRVEVGTANSLDYKIKFAAHLLKNEDGKGLSQTDAGTLNASIIREDGTIRPTFAQGDGRLAVLPTPTPAPTPPPLDAGAPAASAAPGAQPTPTA